MVKKFIYSSRGPGRPQILLMGNGLEYKSGQKSWEQLLNELTVPDALPIASDHWKHSPFPLLYQLLSTHMPAPTRLTTAAIHEEEMRLAVAIKGLTNETNEFLSRLPSLGVDHIFTTNYSYCVEKAFFPKANFSNSSTRSKLRFRLSDKQERDYKLQSGYLAHSATRDTGIWHIHGEAQVPNGVVMSHDRYGRLLTRIVKFCDAHSYHNDPNTVVQKEFNSWPELFLYGDVYILGLKLDISEFDLWWLLRRKQREQYADGKVYYYEARPNDGYTEMRHLLMKATGITLCNIGFSQRSNYDSFYHAALDDIKQKIAQSR